MVRFQHAKVKAHKSAIAFETYQVSRVNVLENLESYSLDNTRRSSIVISIDATILL